MARGGARGDGWRRPLLPGSGPLAGVHPAIAFLGVLAVFLVAVWWGGTPGAVLLLALALAVGALLAATWQRLRPPDRAIRVLALLVLVAIALQEWM